MKLLDLTRKSALRLPHHLRAFGLLVIEFYVLCVIMLVFYWWVQGYPPSADLPKGLKSNIQDIALWLVMFVNLAGVMADKRERPDSDFESSD